MKIQNNDIYFSQQKPLFKGFPAIKVVSNIESNILLNKGVTDLGGFVIPQAIMANNKDESIERVFKSALYFAATFISPFILLPIINKAALSHFCKAKNLKGNEKKILEVSKKFLTIDSKYMEEGIKNKSKELFGNENEFNIILNKYENKENLRNDLIKIHSSVLFADFLTTNLMVASNPWLANLMTKYRTNRSGYSGTYVMADEEFTQKEAIKHDKTKKLRQGTTVFFAILPALLIPPLLKKGMSQGQSNSNKILKLFSKHADKFDYKNSIYMSRLTAFIMWVSSMFLPLQFACRDKYEQRDAFIRGTSIGLVFWGGDLLLKRCFAQISDKLFKTRLMNKETNKPYYLAELKNYKNIDKLKDISQNVMKRTQKASVALYTLNLGLIMATLGFGLPAVLNKILRTRVNKDMSKEKLKEEQNIIS